MSCGTGDTTLAPRSTVSSHSGPLLVLGKLAMNLGLSKVTTDNPNVILVSSGPQDRNDPQSLFLSVWYRMLWTISY